MVASGPPDYSRVLLGSIGLSLAALGFVSAFTGVCRMVCRSRRKDRTHRIAGAFRWLRLSLGFGVACLLCGLAHGLFSTWIVIAVYYCGSENVPMGDLCRDMLDGWVPGLLGVLVWGGLQLTYWLAALMCKEES